MRRVKKLLKFIGVTLCVAPILSVASAQQGSSQADLLLEMQEMRREIAELRDMVERQQFQMRKLQRSQATSARPGMAPDASTSQAGLYSPNQPADPNFDGSSLNGSNVQEPPYSQSEPMRSGQTAAETGFADEGYTDVESRTNQSVYQNQEPVQERVITAPPLGNQSGGSSGYPPVVDRSIGAPLERSSSSAAERMPVNGGNRPGNGNEAMASRNLPPATDDYRRYDTPSGQTQPNPIYRPPGQTQGQAGGQQTRQPSQTVRPGGVVAIPPVSTLPSNRESEYGSDYGSREASNTATVANTDPKNGISTALSEGDYYRQGFDLMKQSNFDEAVDVFKKQLAAYPQGESADDAHYWIAEAMYVSRDLDVAKKHLRTLIQEYPSSRRVPDAMLKTAYIEQQQGNQIEARILFQEIVNFFPKSDAAIAAKNRLADSD